MNPKIGIQRKNKLMSWSNNQILSIETPIEIHSFLRPS